MTLLNFDLDIPMTTFLLILLVTAGIFGIVGWLEHELHEAYWSRRIGKGEVESALDRRRPGRIS